MCERREGGEEIRNKVQTTKIWAFNSARSWELENRVLAEQANPHFRFSF